ncbi:MAG: putative transcriptional regulator [Bryobacterales bacterium]|jgi:BlaI family penicillinase repressor|nr:putative transcriptional regulator [Bryobacterales bacterium]
MTGLSRRERQLLDILYTRGRATAAEIQTALPDPPSYSATRALLRILEQKGHIRHESDGPRYVFLPRISRQKARAIALKHMLATFFDGSAAEAAAALVDGSAAKLSPAELDQLQALIDRARKENKS